MPNGMRVGGNQPVGRQFYFKSAPDNLRRPKLKFFTVLITRQTNHLMYSFFSFITVSLSSIFESKVTTILSFTHFPNLVLMNFFEFVTKLELGLGLYEGS